MDFNKWWNKDSKEVYWLEVTNRKDLGVDLNAPQLRDDGQEYYGYSLVREINDGDIIFHYHMDKKAIVACSRASGNTWEDKIVWGARGTTARGEGVQPYIRSGWRLGLIDFQELDSPVSLEQIRGLERKIQEIRGLLETEYGQGLYFPFELSNKRALRPTQAYLTKLPRAIVDLVPTLMEAVLQEPRFVSSASANISFLRTSRVAELGMPYRIANEETAISESEPFTVDPALVERAHHSHALTQNALAEYLRSKGFEPRSPSLGEPNFDIAWLQDGLIYVAEIKSLTSVNEEHQLRLGVGQVLRYRHGLARRGKQVQAVIMVEREPSDHDWITICQDLDILLIWPATMTTYF